LGKELQQWKGTLYRSERIWLWGRRASAQKNQRELNFNNLTQKEKKEKWGGVAMSEYSAERSQGITTRTPRQERAPELTVIPGSRDETHTQNKANHAYLFFKRLFDIVLSALALIVLSPLFLVIAIIIKATSKGPVIFKQERIGKDGVPFQMYKFRSMVENAEALLPNLLEKNERDGPVFKIAQDPRMTPIGYFMRKTCIDELPQLVNIVKGEMTIVGPRPPLPCEVEQYTPYQMQRLSVTPGLTCIWQISKHEAPTFDEWVEMDIKYIRERSLGFDAKLVLRTVSVVIFHQGEL
jgi:lipopolysaccharide/colanic/teichoic acid biosynthesis glycosyltransferase